MERGNISYLRAQKKSQLHLLKLKYSTSTNINDVKHFNSSDIFILEEEFAERN